MRGLKLMAVLLAAAMLAGEPAAAQYRDRNFRNPNRIRPPIVMMIRPREAVDIALQAAPNAQPLGVQRRGSHYIVKLKQGNRIVKMRIDAQSGAIQ